MTEQFLYNERSFTVRRYPESRFNNLQAWNAADAHILKYVQLKADLPHAEGVAIYHDRFGFLSTVLNTIQPDLVVAFKSQEKAIEKNRVLNDCTYIPSLTYPLHPFKKKKQLILLKVPKALDLFELYLVHIHQSLCANGTVICGFMTRHFTEQMLRIARSYFKEIKQSQAWKKSRLLILSHPNKTAYPNLINTFKYNGNALQQYRGVFSAEHVDYATQFLLQHLKIEANESQILDMASGNGVIAQRVHQLKPEARLYLVDDFWLAIASSKLNIKGENIHFYYDDNLSAIANNSLDLIVSNPPFHIEHENSIEVALSLFKEVKRCLKPTGRFEMVANRHLPYRFHLKRLFKNVKIVAQNERYIIYRSTL